MTRRFVFACVLFACAGACGGAPLQYAEAPPPPPPPPPAALSAEAAPAADRDGDGIVDAKDKCPDQPEDKDGYQDEDGCPDPDNDSDGIPDARDKCPNEPGPLENFGCPVPKGAAREDVSVSTPKAPPSKPAPIEPSTPLPPSGGRAVANDDQRRWVVAVMDVELTGEKSISKQTTRALSDQMRVFLAQRRLKVIDRGAQDEALRRMVSEEKKKSYAACVDTACQIPLGKVLAATHILRTTVASFGQSTCTTNAELIDLKTEVTVAGESARSACKPNQLLDTLERLADQLISESAGR